MERHGWDVPTVEVGDSPLHDLRLVLAALPLCALLLVGLVTGSTPITMAGVAVSILVALAAPSVGLMVLLFITPFLSRPVLPAPGYPVVLAAVVVLGSIYRLPVERPRLRIGVPVVLAAAFVAFVFLNQIPALAAGYQSTIDRFTGSLMTKQIAGLLVIIGASLRLYRRSPFPVLTMILLAAALGTIVAVTSGPDGSGPLGALVAPSSDARARASGAFGNPNEYGSYVAMSITLAVGLLLATRHWAARVALAIVVGILVVGIILAFSRSAIISLAIGLVALVFVRDRRAGVVVVLVALATLAITFPLLVDARLTSSLGSADPMAQAALAGSDASRLARVLAGPDLFLSSPIFGVGLGGYHAITGDASHNWYMTVIAEEGLAGAAIWLFLLLAYAIGLRSRSLTPRSIGFACLAVFVVGSLFTDPPHEDQSSLTTAAILTAAYVANWGRQRLTARAPAPPVHRSTPSHRQASTVPARGWA
jgi:O-antigen ligase